MSLLFYLGSGLAVDDVQSFEADAPTGAGVAVAPLVLSNADDPPLPALRLLVYTRPDLDTVDGELTKKRSAQWQPQLSETGSAVFRIGADDEMLPIADDQLIAIETYGQVVMSVVPDLDTYKTLNSNGPAGREVELRCKGSGWVLQTDGVVAPTRGAGSRPIEDDRAFGWYIPQYDVTGWYAANQITSTITAWWSGIDNWPGGLGSSTYGHWIWGIEGDTTYAPAGDCFFRKDFTVSTAGVYTIFLIADDRAHLYLDGQRVLVTGNWTNSNQDIATIEVDLSVGDHTIAVWAQNNPGEVGNNPAGIRCAVAIRNLDGTVSNAPIVKSDSSWVCTSYPIYVPGVSPGLILRLLLEEAQARGALLDVTLDFTDDYDSAGVQWMTYNDITTKVGCSILTFLREISDTYVDWRMSPSKLELSMWNLDGSGVATGHSWHPHTDPDDAASGNLRELVQKRQR